jgi:tRNA(Arg) A34 adenosine deaminase TadA
MRKLFFLFIGFLIFGALFLFSFSKWYLKNPRWQADARITQKLQSLGDSALTTADVPVAAVLLFDQQIIGEGYNTVRSGMMAGGHAEINAISAAMKRTGVDSFMKLDRSRLMLVTTWEPCLMCRGAIVEYNIRHVVVMKTKPMDYWIKQWEKIARYEWHKQRSASDTLQDQLFRKHPLYHEQVNY